MNSLLSCGGFLVTPDDYIDLVLLRGGAELDPDARVKAEEKYRSTVLKALRAAPEPDLEPLEPRLRRRRIEGRVLVPDADGNFKIGLVMFAVGDDGKGVISDIVSKDALPAARGLWAADSQADFILVITTVPPNQAVLERAEEKSPKVLLGGVSRPAIWVMGIPELTERVLVHQDALRRAEEQNGKWWNRLLRRPPAVVPHPLLGI
jgi:hypothetical protein